jgi:hypothetical protein
VYGSPARLRIEREEMRRSNAPVVISTLLSLLVVGAAIAGVAYLVLRSPSSAVDSAERLEPVGTALPAPSEPPAVATPIPTSEPDRDTEPEPTALGFTGEAPAVAGLPTVAAPQEITSDTAGPTPTPRVIALPTAVPPTAPPPAPTLPPPVNVDDVPVVALEPVESAPPPAPAAAPQSPAPAVTEPTPVPVVLDDDPFNIFGDGAGSGIVPAQNDALERARALQGQGDSDRAANGNRNNNSADSVIVEAPIVPSETGRGGTVEIVMPDVDAMIDEITARATDPNRNPNVANAGPSNSGRAQDNDGGNVVTEPRENRRKSARERINERNSARSSTSRSPSVVVPVVPNPNVPVIVPSGPGNDDQECEDPFANLPEDMRPENFPFSNC